MPWSRHLHDILGHLKRGGQLEPGGLPKHDGRLDLRGAPFPQPRERDGVTFSSPELPYDYLATTIEGKFKVENVQIEDADFSTALMDNTDWRRCVFRRARFSRASLRDCAFTACHFEDVSFEGADLRGALLGGYAAHDTNEFRRTAFPRSDLRDTAYRYPLFEDCDFSRAKLDKVDFEGSRFSRCRFSGKMIEVWFRGFYSRPHPRDLDYFKRLEIDSSRIRNPMVDVDFSEAYLDDVMFVDEIDLSHCRFPQDEKHIVIGNRQGVYSAMERTIDSQWHGAARVESLEFLRQLRERSEKKSQLMDVINRETYEADRSVAELWSRAFFDLLQDLARRGPKDGVK